LASKTRPTTGDGNGKLCNALGFSHAFSNVLMGENASYFDNFDSMEKLWFAFITLEKYKRKWNDGEWV
jgi:hypothetical protein